MHIILILCGNSEFWFIRRFYNFHKANDFENRFTKSDFLTNFASARKHYYFNKNGTSFRRSRCSFNNTI